MVNASSRTPKNERDRSWGACAVLRTSHYPLSTNRQRPLIINHDEALIINHEKIIYFGAVYYCAISKKKLPSQNQFVLNKECAINHIPRLLAMKSPTLCRRISRACRRKTPCLLTPDIYYKS